MYTTLDAIRDIQSNLETEYSDVVDELTIEIPVANPDLLRRIMTYQNALYQVIKLLERITDIGRGIEEDTKTQRNSAEPAPEQSDKAFTDNDTEERRVN